MKAEEAENAARGEGEQRESTDSMNSALGHNAPQTDSDSDIASSRPSSPPPDESKNEESKESEVALVKEEPQAEDTVDLASEESSLPDASEQTSWLAETQLPKRKGKLSSRNLS